MKFWLRFLDDETKITLEFHFLFKFTVLGRKSDSTDEVVSDYLQNTLFFLELLFGP